MGIAQIFVWMAASCAYADAPTAETNADAVDFYLSTMLVQREKIGSGEFVVSGTKTAKSAKTPQLDYTGKLLIFCAFDENRVRMDNLEPALVAAVPTNPQGRRPGRIERRFFRTPQQTVTWFQSEETNRIVIAGANSAMLGRCLFFDVRGLGLTTWDELTDPDSLRVGAAADGLKRRPGEKSVDTSDPEYVQLIFTEELGPWSKELRYWLRRDQGLTPVRQEARARKAGDADQHWQIVELAETTWEQVGSVWVPSRFDMTRTDGMGEERFAWKINWRAVNKPIDEALFDWRDFGAPDTVEIINVSQGTPVIVRQSPKK